MDSIEENTETADSGSQGNFEFGPFEDSDDSDVRALEALKAQAVACRHDSAAWILTLVSLANRWEAKSVTISFPSGGVRLEMADVGDKRSFWQSLLDMLWSGDYQKDHLCLLLLRALGQALEQSAGSVVLAASGLTAQDECWATKIGLSGRQAGGANLPVASVVFQVFPLDSSFLSHHGDGLLKALKTRVASDRTRVDWGGSVPAFRCLEEELEEEIELGLWGHLGLPKGWRGIPLGHSFDHVDASGIARSELTFGIFRTGLLGQGEKGQARSLVVFSHLEKAFQSRLVWLEFGRIVGYQYLCWEPNKLVATVFVEVPQDNDLVPLSDEWSLDPKTTEICRQATVDLRTALEATVSEYNHYRPKAGLQVLGCWSGLALGSLGLAGLLAPFLGSPLAFSGGALLAPVLMYAELYFRRRKRYIIGQSLAELAAFLELEAEESRWNPELIRPA